MAFLWNRTTTDPLDHGLTVAAEELGPECRVRLTGRITFDSSPGLRSLLLRRLDHPGCQSLTADFDGVVYVDTSGLAILVETLRAARNKGKAFRLQGLQERPRYFLEAMRLLHLFNEPEAGSGAEAGSEKTR